MIFVWDRSGGSSFSTNLFIVSINGRSYDQPKDFGVAVMFAVCHEWRFPKMGKKPISYILIGIPFLYTIHFGGSPILGNLHIPHKPKTSTKWCAKQLGNILGGLTLITTGKVFWKRFFFNLFLLGREEHWKTMGWDHGKNRRLNPSKTMYPAWLWLTVRHFIAR